LPPCLFLVGIGTTFKIKHVRWLLASIGLILLVIAVVLISQQPIPP
jgi:hypothetical protein